MRSPSLPLAAMTILPTARSRYALRRYFALLCTAFVFAAAASFISAADAPAKLGVGATFETLQAGAVTYHHAQVRSLNARSMMIIHDGGLSSVRLKDLSPELRAAFGYDPQADAALDAAQVEAAQKLAKENQSKPTAKKSHANAQFENLLQSFGQPPEIRTGVDLRPQFLELELNVKNQGPRPSCAVFAIVGALEYQNARLTGKAERFSEEYLVWAASKILNRAPHAQPDMNSAGGETENPENLDGADEGFSLAEVVTAIRTYGIPLQASLPYSFAKAGTFADPPGAVVDEAKNHRRVSVISLPGRDQDTRLANLIQALDADTPVAIGLMWPAARTIRTGYVSGQKPVPGHDHALAVVGYENKTGAINDTVFIFKNSWGVKWGAGGYGYITYAYLTHNLLDAVLLDVGPPETTKSAR
jgi:hypothetical protein